MVIIKFWAIVCFFNAIHGLEQWLQYPIVSSAFVHDVHQKLSSQELKTDNDKESAEVLTKENYFTRLTPVENSGSKVETRPTITDITYNYSNLVLTTTINLFRKKMFTSNLNITEEDNTSNYTNKNIRETKFAKKQHRDIDRYEKSEDFFQNRVFTRSESDSRETSTEANYHYRVHTPARRIFHGHKTKIKHFPFLVTVHVLGRFVCGGTIIKSDLVITAAHCLKRWQEWVRHTTTTPETMTYETTTDETTTISIDDIEPKTIDTTITISSQESTTYPPTTDVTETITINYDPGEDKDRRRRRGRGGGGGDKDRSNEIYPPTTAVTETIRVSSEESGKNSSYETYPPKTVVTEETSTLPTFGVLSVRIGTNYYRLGGKVVQVINVYFHPSYNEKNLQDNLVIMRLERHLSFKRRRVRKIDISTDTSDVPEGTEVTIAGWGAKTYHNKIFNALWNLIHKAVLTVSSRDECVDTYTKNFVSTTNFCALSEHHEGACNGDAGNPAVVDGLLVGVVSFGPPDCGQWDAPTVFTNVGYYADWIGEVMGMDLTSSSASDEKNTDPDKTTTEMTTTTQCAGWTTKTTTTTEPFTFGTPVYYDGNTNIDEDDQDLTFLRIYPRRKFENVKLRKRFRVVEIDDSAKHSATTVPLDNTLPKIFTLSEPTTIERILLLTPNTPRNRNDLDL